jgi:hypothetical protein
LFDKEVVMKSTRATLTLTIGILSVSIVIGLAGCGALVNIAHVIWGNKVAAEYSGLEGKRVAIVCVMKSAPYGRDRTPEMLARFVELTLQKEVSGIEIVQHEEVADWTDNHDWEGVDFNEIGRAVNAERVLAIELSSYSLHSGQTMYQGKVDAEISVYDIEDRGRVKFHKDLFEYKFPENHGRPAIGTSEKKFEQGFLRMLSAKIANYFYDYDMATDVATDAAMQD